MSIRGIVGSAQIIGRDAELEVASEVVGAALHERGPVLWVSGEAGIGKSRLVREVIARQAEEGESASFRLVEGRCLEFDRPIPYALVRDLLRVVRDTDALATPGIREATALLEDTAASGAGERR